MANCIGFDGKLYYNTGTDAAPTWVEITNARDVTTSASADNPEISDRGSKFKKYCAGMLDLETTVTLSYHNGDTVIAALRDKFLAREAVQIAVLDGPEGETGSEGFVYYAHVTGNDFEQPLNDGMTVSVTFVPARVVESNVVVEPEWRTF